MANYQISLYKHGLIVMLIGLISGFFLAFSLLGEIGLSPIPFAIEMEIFGSPARWKAAHLGNMMNGMVLILFATALPNFKLSDSLTSKITLGLLITAWGNFAFYMFALIAPNRGLSFEGNRLGEFNWAGPFSYVGGVLAAVALISISVALIRALPKSK
ncbi:MAG: hypothetical protein KUG61_04070 [Parvibaculaceae bacterium]|nr:hypothetical protein [Parvibaculaceae bacterium]